MGRRESVGYTSIPPSELDEHERLPRHKSGLPLDYVWKGLAVLSVLTNVLTISALFFIPNATLPSSSSEHDECHLDAERLWPHPVPWKKVVLENHQDFIDSDPWDSKFAGDGTTSKSEHASPWDAIFLPNWVALENDPAAHGYGFGTPLTGPGSEGNEQDPIPWTPGSQAFGLAVMHQLHCIASIKKAVNDYRYTGGDRGSNSSSVIGHVDHCIEVLRQATMCHGDMSLLRPNVQGHSYTGYDGWGNEHLCRDWEAIEDIVRTHGISFKKGGGVEGWTHLRQDVSEPRDRD